MSKYLLTLTLLLALATTSYATVVGDFEDATLDGWVPDADNPATLSQSATGATLGSWAMQIDMLGDWYKAAEKGALANRGTLAIEGARIIMDATVSAVEGGTWSNIEIVINAQSNDDSGPNNNIGWNSLGGQDIVRDGSTNTFKWTIDATLANKIAGIDDSIW